MMANRSPNGRLNAVYANGTMDSPLSEDELEGGDVAKQRSTDDERIKRRAKRPSAKIAGNGQQSVNGSVNAVNANECGIFKKMSKNSRRPRGRYGRGLPKKGGAGGKGTWGIPGSELVGVEESIDDPQDPNYDSDSQDICKFEAITPPLNEDEIEKRVIPVISEYLENGDTEEVAMSLEELNLGDNLYQVVVIVVSLAMERKDAHRELTSVLISDLYGRILPETEIERGFDVLLKSLPDLILDTPTAPTVLGSFIARAVADDCIPPKYVQNCKVIGDCPHIRDAIDHASALLNMKHGLVRLDTVWGVSGGMRPVKYLIRQIQLLLKEFVSSGDTEEATRCLRELEVPHFYHEFVYEAVLMVIEDMRERTLDLICLLLKSLYSSAVVTVDQLRTGFFRVYEEMPEICIDVPLAYNILEKLVNKCAAQNSFPAELVKSLPTRGRKRFVSEGDGGKVKENE